MFRFLTAGESHGPALTSIVEGVPGGLRIDFDEINRQLKRRQGGHGRGARQQIETDTVEVLSGVRFGLTMGGPITMVTRNRDFANWTDKMSVTPIESAMPPVVHARPGHADYAGMMKYATDDLRNILERSSARTTVMLVAVGGLCRSLLQAVGIRVMSHVSMIGGIEAHYAFPPDYDAIERASELSPVRVADKEAEALMISAIDLAGARGDTLGGVVEVVVSGCVPGLGSHVHWDRKLDSRLAGAIMGVQAIKGVEIGMGFGVGWLPGSKVHDELFHDEVAGFTRSSNSAGGLEGGMTNGEPIVIRAAMKPISTMKTALRSVDMSTKEAVSAHFERSDICAVPAAGVICEAMAAIVITEAVIEKFGGDSMTELTRNYSGYVSELHSRGYRCSSDSLT